MQVCLGIDWSRHKHDAVFMNEAGASLVELTIAHDLEGFGRLTNTCKKLGGRPA